MYDFFCDLKKSLRMFLKNFPNWKLGRFFSVSKKRIMSSPDFSRKFLNSGHKSNELFNHDKKPLI